MIFFYYFGDMVSSTRLTPDLVISKFDRKSKKYNVIFSGNHFEYKTEDFPYKPLTISREKNASNFRFLTLLLGAIAPTIFWDPGIKSYTSPISNPILEKFIRL